jgi:beta-fructofuranosidase
VALRLADKWIWDFWLVDDGGTHHIFYLQAPKSIGDPELRHWNVSIGHAVSSDLVDWEVVPDALVPGPEGAWDDLTTWTGSIVRHGARWHLFYTGTSSAESGLVQRIGLAVSDDLVVWERHGSRPLIEADPLWYETFDAGDWHDQAWRDPWVFHHDDGWFHATITARVNRGHRHGRGVLAHARSHDLIDWEVLPPLTTPDGFGQVEVSQLTRHRHHWYMTFCSDLLTQSDHRRATGPGTGTYYLRASDPFGPYPLDQARALKADQDGSSYAGRLVSGSRGDLLFLSWERTRPGAGFVGAVSDPIHVLVGEDGHLTLAESE